MFVAIRGASSRVSNFSADPLNLRFADWLNMLRKFWSFLVQLFESRGQSRRQFVSHARAMPFSLFPREDDSASLPTENAKKGTHHKSRAGFNDGY